MQKYRDWKKNQKLEIFKMLDKAFGHLNIGKQILWSMTVVSILTIVALGLVIFAFSKKRIENNYQASHLYNLQVSSNIIEIELEAIVEQGRSLLIEENLKKVLLEETSRNGYFSSKNKLILERILSNVASRDVAIQGMLVINEQGNWRFFSKNSTQSGLMNHYYTTDKLLKENWVSVAKEAKGKEVFFGYNVLFDDEKNNTFSMVKNLINPSTQKSMGYLVVNIKKSLLDKAFGTKREGYLTNRYMILDTSLEKNTSKGLDNLVYFNGDEAAKENILKDYLDGMEGGKYLYSNYHNKIADWDIVNVIEKEELSRDSNYVGWIIVLAGFIMVVLSIYVSAAISRQISRPLNMLEQTIQEVGEGNFKINAEFDQSEIGKIGNQFKSMVTNNLELRERLLNSEIKEREAELLLLQSQINPHFLYNTLDSLYFMALIDNADDIADMVLALSDTFKLSLNKGNKLIRVRDEIAKMKAYMKIQNLRYHNRFDFQLEVDEEILDLKMLTFILQPVVENSMYHGLEAKIGNGYIRVEGYREKDMLHFIISDNGVGIEDMEKLEKGYGVHNIRERIRLFYGEEYQLNFVSEVNVGTTATFVIPVIKEDGKNVQACSD